MSSLPSRGNMKQNLHCTRPCSGPTEPLQPPQPCTPSSRRCFGVQRGGMAGEVLVTHPLLPRLPAGGQESRGGRAFGMELTQKPQKRILGAGRGGTGVGKEHGAWQSLVTHGWGSNPGPGTAAVGEPPSHPGAVPGAHPALTERSSPS